MGALGRIHGGPTRDFVDRSPGAPAEAHGTAWVQQQYESTYGAFPDLRFTLEDVLAEGDKVVMRWSSKGKFSGKLGDVAGHGQDVTVEGISIFRIQDGKIIESWDLVDRLAMLRYGVDDLRLFYENDLRFLKQFA